MNAFGFNMPAHENASGLVNVIIDTPSGSRNKYKLDEELGLFRLSRILPAGMSFPYDFGSIPRTRAADGDPLNRPRIRGLHEIGPVRLQEIEQFFVAYNRFHGREFKPIGRVGAKAAQALLRQAMRAFAQDADG